MNQLSLHEVSGSSYPIEESTLLENGSNDENSNSPSLAAPKPFFGHRVIFSTVIDHYEAASRNRDEITSLRLRLLQDQSVPTNLPQRIRALKGRAEIHEILEQEIADELLETSRTNILLESRLLSAELPASFFGSQPTNNFNNIQRKQRQRIAAMINYEDKANRLFRKIRQKEKFCALLKEHKELVRAKAEEKIIEQLKNQANRYVVMVRNIHAQVYNHDEDAPGSHHVVPQGNYELTFPIRPPSSTVKAKKIKNPKEDLIRLPKTPAVAFAKAKFSKSKKLLTKREELPIAKKVLVQEVTATLPKNIKLPEAQVSPI